MDDFDVKSMLIGGLGSVLAMCGVVILKQGFQLKKEKSRIPVDTDDFSIVKQDLATFVCSALNTCDGDSGKLTQFMDVGDKILNDPKVKEAAEKYYRSKSRDISDLMYLYRLFTGEEG